jgi:hypothetical protein
MNRSLDNEADCTVKDLLLREITNPDYGKRKQKTEAQPIGNEEWAFQR